MFHFMNHKQEMAENKNACSDATDLILNKKYRQGNRTNNRPGNRLRAGLRFSHSKHNPQ